MSKLRYKRPSGTDIEVADTKGNRAEAARLNWTEIKKKAATPSSNTRAKVKRQANLT